MTCNLKKNMSVQVTQDYNPQVPVSLRQKEDPLGLHVSSHQYEICSKLPFQK